MVVLSGGRSLPCDNTWAVMTENVQSVFQFSVVIFNAAFALSLIDRFERDRFLWTRMRTNDYFVDLSSW